MVVLLLIRNDEAKIKNISEKKKSLAEKMPKHVGLDLDGVKLKGC
jgi:hypothetical protein